MTATIFAPIKINLALHVGPPRQDGYHPVDTLCVFPAIGDILTYDPEGEPGIDFGGRFGAALAGEGPGRNLIWRAFRLLDLEPKGRFFLAKETPIASGVGAGTADGAAAMLLLNDLWDLGLGEHQLRRRALGLGADGPVCLTGQVRGGGILRARGIGERVEALGRTEPVPIVVANPGFAVPTGPVFRRFDDTAPEALRPVSSGPPRDPEALVARNRNDLQAPAIGMAPAISELLETLQAQAGARVAAMSGSGATCFAFHASGESAARAARQLRSKGLWAESSFILPG